MARGKKRRRQQSATVPLSTGIRAAEVAPGPFRLCGASGPLEIEAAADGDTPSLKKFSMVAYTGGAMRLGWYGAPVVVDLEGMNVPSETLPILKGHDPDRIVGHSVSINKGGKVLKLSGVLSGVGDDAEEVRALAVNGFPWQASIGASVEKMEFTEAGSSTKANGKTWPGPVYVARATTLGEVSFVPMGADNQSSATVAATATTGDNSVNFETWLRAKGFDPATINDTQKAYLKAAFDAEQKPAPTPVVTPPVQAATVPDPAADLRAAASKEIARQAEIRRVHAKYPDVMIEVGEGDQKRKVDLFAHAIAENWDAQRYELEALRASRDSVRVLVPAGGPTGSARAAVIEAALCINAGMPGVEKHYKPEVLEAAQLHFRNLGLQQLLLTAAAENGYHAGPGARIHTGNAREILRAAFSSVSLPGILSNVATKEILTGYMEEDQSWREIAAIKTVTDFKQFTSYRMLDSMEYEEVGPAGEIKGGTVDQESYTRQAKTYAKMFALTRQDIINDDLGAFDDLRARLGRGAAQKFNNVFWTNMLANHSTFFTTARTNYITGSTTTLLTDGVGLGLGIKAFRQMKTPTADGAKRVGGRPEILLVPPELEYAADCLFQGEKVNVGSGPGDTNIYRGKYRPVVSAWLSDSNFTGYSTTAWYLFRSPGLMPMMTASFLNGQQMPTVESAEADFNVLGVQFRGYHDFGCDQAEYLCGIKSKGAA